MSPPTLLAGRRLRGPVYVPLPTYWLAVVCADRSTFRSAVNESTPRPWPEACELFRTVMSRLPAGQDAMAYTLVRADD